MRDYERVVYSINAEDIQTVAVKEFGRALTEKELSVVEEKLGDCIKWYEAIEMAISIFLDPKPSKNDS